MRSGGCDAVLGENAKTHLAQLPLNAGPQRATQMSQQTRDQKAWNVLLPRIYFNCDIEALVS